MAVIAEIAPDVYRISVFAQAANLQFNHFLVKDDEPLLYHTGLRGFTKRDINAMTRAFNLANYDHVKAHAATIYGRIRGIGGPIMAPPPPRASDPLPQSRMELFAQWMADGYQP